VLLAAAQSGNLLKALLFRDNRLWGFEVQYKEGRIQIIYVKNVNNFLLSRGILAVNK
jgi:hypothetical protein